MISIPVFNAKLLFSTAMVTQIITRHIIQSHIIATTVNSSSRTSLLIIVPRRAFNFPVTEPSPPMFALSTKSNKEEEGKGKEKTHSEARPERRRPLMVGSSITDFILRKKRLPKRELLRINDAKRTIVQYHITILSNIR